jgi:hypothetical protein
VWCTLIICECLPFTFYSETLVVDLCGQMTATVSDAAEALGPLMEAHACDVEGFTKPSRQDLQLS